MKNSFRVSSDSGVSGRKFLRFAGLPLFVAVFFSFALSATADIGSNGLAEQDYTVTYKEDHGVVIPDAPAPTVLVFPESLLIDGSGAASLLPGYEFEAQGKIIGMLGVVKDGEVVGYFDEPFAIVGTELVTLGWQVSGNTLTLDRSALAKVNIEYHLELGYSPTNPLPPNMGFVGIPSRYKYDLNHKDKALHDYCTSSPDKWRKADFRGPCAKHDMCYERNRGNKIARQQECNNHFMKDLIENCDHAYGVFTVERYTCGTVARAYYAAVTTVNVFA